MIALDFETRSRCDLRTKGASNYALDESTSILCCVLVDLDDDKKLRVPFGKFTLPKEWVSRIKRTDYMAAHNAAFDRDIYKYCAVDVLGWPEVPDSKWYCTAAQCRVNNLPAGLEDAAVAAQIRNRKGFAGAALIKQLSIPQPDGTFNESPKLMADMLKYCDQDVDTMVELLRSTRLMTDEELHDWHVNERINERGVKVDLELAELAQSYAGEEQALLSEQLSAASGGKITKVTQSQRIKNYVLEALEPDNKSDQIVLKLMTVYKKGEKKYSLDKDIRGNILDMVDTGALELFEDVESLIRTLDAGSMSSVTKFKTMAQRADADDERVRGAFIYYGASQTGRYSSKGLQLHNMVRKCFTPDELVIHKDMMRSNETIDNIMRTLSMMLRPALIPEEGKKFVVGDWSAIEGRVLPWLSDDPDADEKLDLFSQGVDMYVKTAERMGLGAEARQIGKVAELALGFGGANGAFMSMAKNYGLMLPEHEVTRVVEAWRKANPWAQKFWRKLESAAKKAIQAKGIKPFRAGRVSYLFDPHLLGGTLVCTLPDGSTIQYAQARLEADKYGTKITALRPAMKPAADDKSGEWGRVALWYGILAENITQATAARLLHSSLRACDKLPDLPVVADVHDEIILEVPADKAVIDAKSLQCIMETPPQWAEGLPLEAEPVVLDRYGNH